MSIAELTAKIESLSADDYNMVIMLVDRLSEKELTESIQKSDKGVTKPARTVSKSMREKYAV